MDFGSRDHQRIDTSSAGLGKDLLLNPPGADSKRGETARSTAPACAAHVARPTPAPVPAAPPAKANDEKLQGKFYAHQNTAADLVVCSAPRKLGGSAVAAPSGPQKLSSAPPHAGAPDAPTTGGRTLASRTDVVVCEPPRRIGAAGAAADAPRKLSSAGSGGAPAPPVAAHPKT